MSVWCHADYGKPVLTFNDKSSCGEGHPGLTARQLMRSHLSRCLSICRSSSTGMVKRPFCDIENESKSSEKARVADEGVLRRRWPYAARRSAGGSRHFELRTAHQFPALFMAMMRHMSCDGCLPTPPRERFPINQKIANKERNLRGLCSFAVLPQVVDPAA